MISIRFFTLTLTAITLSITGTAPSPGQAPPAPPAQTPSTRPAAAHKSLLKGRIVFDDARSVAFNGASLKIEFPEMEARLREYVKLPPAPYPAEFESWEAEKQNQWLQEFSETEAGRAIIEANRKLLEAANSFEIKFDPSGAFTVYDVPAGEYAIQGRIDKAIGEVTYAYEVFGQLTVSPDVDEVLLAPIQIEITPLLKRGQTAPPIQVDSADGKSKIQVDELKGKTWLVNFWSLADPNAVAEQQQIQQLAQNLQAQSPLELLSVNIDTDVDQARKFIQEQNLKLGTHGLAGGPEHIALFHYGVRGVPSYWLIDSNGKILMSPQEIGSARQSGASLELILQQRLQGTDQPIPAEPKIDGQ